MRIVGVMIARNEEDIVEASIRHNLRVVDALVVVDHASTDATPGILASLAGEGLPLELSRDDSLGYLQSAMTTRLVRDALAGGADLCVPIDADEFLRVPSRTALEDAVAASDPKRHLAMRWTAYLPDFDMAGDIVAKLRHARRRSREGHDLHKVILRRAMLDTPDAVVGHGNHDVLARDGAAPAPAVVLDEGIASVAHVPVRSVEQYTAKVAVGYLSRLLGRPEPKEESLHFREAFEAILAGKGPTRDRLDAIVANYGVRPDRRSAIVPGEWTEDPFLADIELRYTPSRPPAPLAQVLAFGERVAAEIAQTTGGL